MKSRQIIFLILLTALYLCFELAFNARLLDVIGGVVDQDRVLALEKYGRALSGVAVGLFVLQVCLGRRSTSKNKRPGLFVTMVLAAGAGIVTFVVLNVGINYWVSTKDAEFRKASVSLVRLKQAMVTGRLRIDGLTEESDLFAQPSGKAFIGLFPYMATSIPNLDRVIEGTKKELIADDVESKAGGLEKFFDRYLDAVKETQSKWDQYRKLPVAADSAETIERKHNESWGQYLSDIGKRGWTPSTVPTHYQGAVRKKVRQRVSVSRDWDLADEQGFREAVARSVTRKLGKADGSVVVKGRRIPAGLGWNEFFAHPAVQSGLRDNLGLPNHVRLQPGYADYQQFERAVYRPMVKHQTNQLMQRYDAPASSFARDGEFAKEGYDAAKAVLVPPIALASSLLGAIVHLGKLLYLLLSLGANASPFLARQQGRFKWASAAVAVMLILNLGHMNNAVTNSRTYAFLNKQVMAGQAGADPFGLRGRVLTGGLHVVSVGQAYGYPINEQVRVQVLRGFTFGYADEK